jgi:hypothetical protein
LINISEKTHDLILKLNEFSGSKIKNLQELSYLVETAETTKHYKLFDDIQFTAKYLNGLGKILQGNITVPANKSSNGNTDTHPDIEAKEKIKEEFRKNMMKISDGLRSLIVHSDKSFKKEFESKYLSLTKESVRNLTTLIYDLSWLKKYYNTKR